MKPFLLIFLVLSSFVIGPTSSQVMPPLMGHNNSTGSNSYTATLTSQGQINLGEAVVRRMPDVNVSRNVNGILYADKFEGADIGAKVNAAAATCITGVPCHIVVAPHAQYSFSTSIVFVPNETVECSPSGSIQNNRAGDSQALLHYRGDGIAVTFSQDSNAASHWIGCDLLLDATAITGILMPGYGGYVIDAALRGGGTGTTLIHVSGTPAENIHVRGNPTEDNHIERSRLGNFIGVGVAIDHANDTYLNELTVYGKASDNTTSVSLLVNDNAGGIIIDNFAGGSSGLHGLWIRHSMGGAYPKFLFANNFETDLASSDGWLFDSTLGSSNLDATFLNSWSAGNGGAGVHIAGGTGIHIGGGSKIRCNRRDGILIDGPPQLGITVEDSFILGNNQSNLPNLSGIRIVNHPGPVTIIGNQIGNYPESGGHQKYALLTESDVEGLIFSNNSCWHNEVGCADVSSVVRSKVTYSGNMAEDQVPLPNYFPGTLTAGAFAGKNIPIVSSLTTTANTRDNVKVTGMTAAGHCQLTPTNEAAASGIASVYVSAKQINEISVSHKPTAGWTFDVACTPN
jgi:hypothetical protein